ncbi:pseudouridine-5'-phosphate glycosidase [Clostridium botulinum]|uniref:pseudouridine-5'-phosphate glycosidase n=1 Tax=Clostridium botulinum TaxID=1491 RepID=UPI000774E422|nr:pseudouridine-5'-phosphate glycosidase [Clostridium botulinum]
MLEKYLEISKEVSEALKENKSVVALESTIISHGMPYPKNAETALNVEKIIRDKGAIPATIAILNGKLKVGLTKDEIEYLGKKGKEVVKTSRRDIPFILAKKLDGATTVASTMIVANLAGIKVFGTGGIGGVHRGAQESFDISADLQELANTNVAVVCAGAKSILDIGLTLECLETQGVPVVGFGTEELPAFYTRKSGFKVDYRVDTAKELAEALKAKWDLGLKGGMVVGNPIPEEYQMDYDTITKAINDAVKEAEEKGIKGKESTPFLLAKIKDITKGKSLAANIQLVYNNVAVASDLAIELSKLDK